MLTDLNNMRYLLGPVACFYSFCYTLDYPYKKVDVLNSGNLKDECKPIKLAQQYLVKNPYGQQRAIKISLKLYYAQRVSNGKSLKLHRQ